MGAVPIKRTPYEVAAKYYGAVDIASGLWPGQSVWLKLLQIPPELLAKLPNWKVLSTPMPVTHIAMNRDMHAPFLNALSALCNAGLGDKLLTFDGCFNVRPVRDMTAVSTHAYGLGFDLNAKDNPLGAESGGFYDMPDLVKCFTDQGFDWGGNFHTRKDPMHFSYAWEGPPPVQVVQP